MKYFKKLVSCMLAFVMALSLLATFPVNANAAEVDPSIPVVSDFVAFTDTTSGIMRFKWTMPKGYEVKWKEDTNFEIEASIDNATWKEIIANWRVKEDDDTHIVYTRTDYLSREGINVKNGDTVYFRLYYVGANKAKGGYSNVSSTVFGTLKGFEATDVETTNAEVSKLEPGVKAFQENNEAKVEVEITAVNGNTVTVKNTVTNKMKGFLAWHIEADVNNRFHEEGKGLTQAAKDIGVNEDEVTYTYDINLNEVNLYDDPQIYNLLYTRLFCTTEGSYGNPFAYGIDIKFLSNVVKEGDKLDLKEITKDSVEFVTTAMGNIYWRKKGDSSWESKEFPNGNPKVTGLKAATTYEFKYVEYEYSLGSESEQSTKVDTVKSPVFTCTTASTKAPSIASIKITGSKNKTYGYRDIWGKWHNTGKAATGKITVTFKTKPTDDYAVIYDSNGIHCVKINGKKAVVKSAQFQKGSKKGGKTKVWVATASTLDWTGMQTGLSPKTKKKSVKIK